MNRAVSALAAALLVGACQAAQADPTTSTAIAWSALPDGSRFAIEAVPADALARSAARCWPKPGGGFACVEVGQIARIGFTAQRFDADALPTGWPIATPTAGYSCGFVPEHDMFNEEVRSATARLTSNEAIPLGGKPWTRRYAEGFLRDNRVAGSPYFACAPFLDRLRIGSLETLGTTAVTASAIR